MLRFLPIVVIHAKSVYMKIKWCVFLLIGACLIFHGAAAQQNLSRNQSFSGIVTDEQGNGLPFVSVVLLNHGQVESNSRFYP